MWFYLWSNGQTVNITPKVFPDPPTGYNEIEKIASSRTWVAPEDGYFKLIGLAQNGFAGRYGYIQGYDDVYYCGGGGGGGAGGITASQFTLKKGQIVEISVTGDISIRCGAEVATATAGENGSDGKGTGQQGYHGVGGYGGYGGSAQGGNIANITGPAGGTGGISTGRDASEAVGKVKAGYTATNTYEGYTTGGAYVVVLRGNTNLSMVQQNAYDITDNSLEIAALAQEQTGLLLSLA